MKNHLRILFFIFTLFSCSTKRTRTDIEYIKVLTICDADSITSYNKNLGLYRYVYYVPTTDSMIYRMPVHIDPNRFETYTGRLMKEEYVDTLLNAVKVLNGYNKGVIPSNISEGDNYCGPELFVEYRDKKGLHSKVFYLGSNDTLDQLSHFFHRLKELPWDKHPANNNIVNGEEEAVTVMKELGFYDKREVPYVPLRCEPSIVKNKIVGTWRSVGDKYNRTSDRNFTKITVLKNGICFSEKVEDGVSTGRTTARFAMDAKENTFTVRTAKTVHKYIILKLSDSCFEYKKMNGDYLMRWDRL